MTLRKLIALAALSTWLVLPTTAWAQEPPHAPAPVTATDTATAPAAPQDVVVPAEVSADSVAKTATPPVPVETTGSNAEADPDFIVTSAKWIIDQARGGNWGLALVALCLLVVFVVRKYFWKSVPKKWVPYLSLVAATGAAVLAALTAGVPVSEAISAGVMTGLAATGAWEAFGPKGDSEKKDAPTDDQPEAEAS